MAVLLVVLVDAPHYNDAGVLVGLVRRRAAVRRVPVLDAAGEGRDEPRAGLRRGDALREAEDERDVAGNAVPFQKDNSLGISGKESGSEFSDSVNFEVRETTSFRAIDTESFSSNSLV